MPRKKSLTPQLPERQAEIMNILWTQGPLSVQEIIAHLPEPHPHYNTVSTTVRILEDKGFVAHEAAGKTFRYKAVAQASDFASRSLAQVIKSYFSNSYRSAVFALVEEEKISVEELREIIDMIKKRNKHGRFLYIYIHCGYTALSSVHMLQVASCIR